MSSHTFPALDTNNTFTGTDTFNGNVSVGGSINPATNATSTLGATNKGFKDLIAAGTPYFDIRAYGGVGDGVTDCLAAFNAAIAATNSNSGGVIYFPRGQWRMSAKPNSIGVGTWIEGEGAGSTPGFGTYIIADYNEVTATNGFLTWDGSFVAAGGTGGGLRNCTVYKAANRTGGTGVKLTGADDNHRAGWWRADHVLISGAQPATAGTWSHCLRVDGQNNSTAGTQGIRDLVFIDLWCCNATVTDQAVVLNNAAKCDWYGGEVFQAGGSTAGITITGTGGVSPSALNSTEVILSLTLSGNVVLDQCNNVIILPDHATGNLTITSNAANSIFWGRVEGTVSNSGASNNCAVVSAGTGGNLALISSGAIGASFDSTGVTSTSGAVFSRTTGTLGIYYFGDGNAFINRTGTNACNFNFGNNATFTFAGTNTALSFQVLTLSGLANKYNNITTAGNGLTSIYGSTSQKTESAADTNVLTFTPPATVGSYRIRFVMSVSAANAATLGWTATWTDSNGNAQTPTNLALTQSGAAAPALTFTTSAAGNYYGYADIDTNNAATAIVVKLTFAGTSFTAKVSATIERVI